MTQPDPAFIVALFEVRDVSTIMDMLDALAITQLTFDLCSAPCKARRFAPPAHARGLRALDGACAQIAFWLLRDVRKVCSGHGTHCRNSLGEELAHPLAVVEPRCSQQLNQVFVC
jgi:hypothetical protein